MRAWRSRYKDGAGVEKDATEAVKWLRKAAEGGDADAQCNLGIMSEQLPCSALFPRSACSTRDGRQT